MSASRRDFLKLLGISLVSVMARGCASKTPTPDFSLTPLCYAPTAAPSETLIAQETIRKCWLQLSGQPTGLVDLTSNFDELSREHRSSLDVLVAADLLAAEVAADVQTAFDQAIAHIERSQVTCYIALPAVYYPRQDLLAQVSLLDQMEIAGSLDPAVVAKVRDALAADIGKLDDFAAGVTAAPEDGSEPDETGRKAAEFLTALLLGNRA